MEQKPSCQNLDPTAKKSRCASPFDSHQAENLEHRLKTFSVQLRRDFAQEITLDARRFKSQVLKLVRRGLPPRPGRPNDPQIDAAVRLVQQGMSLKDVLRLQIPGFERLDTYGRYLAEKGLRAAIARRRKRTTSNGPPP